MQDFHHGLMVITNSRKTEFIYLTTKQAITKWMIEYMVRIPIEFFWKWNISDNRNL